MFNRRQALLGALSLPLAVGTGCGFLLYPDRQGRRYGEIDLPILIIDLLWLIPGIIPGAVCLIVDFGTGCIYRGGEWRRESEAGAGNAAPVAVASVAVDGEVLATGDVHASRTGALAWRASADPTALRSRGELLIRRADGATARAPLAGLVSEAKT